ncbi:MAG: hypothetical protein WD448_06880 [Woeseia sp.]
MNIGVVLDTTRVPAWQYLLLQQLQDHVSIKLLLLHGATSADDAGGKPLFYRMFERYEDARTQKPPPDACRTMDLEDFLGHVEKVDLEKNERGQVLQLAEDARPAAALPSRDLDMILALGRLPASDQLAELPAQGLWFFRHSHCATSCPSGWRVGFWEVIRRRPFLYSSLIRRRPGSPDRVLYQSTSAVNYLSHWKSRNQHLWKLSHFVPRVLRQLHLDVDNTTVRQGTEPGCGNGAAGGVPMTNPKIAPSLAAYAWWRLRQKIIRKLYVKRWVLLVSRDRTEDFSRYRKLVPPKGRFWADPHVIRRNNAWYIFFEDASLAAWRGHISVIESKDGDTWSEPQMIVSRPYHLSYPFLLEWQDELYLIPESGGNRTVELWRCRQFPFDWEFSHNLMHDVPAYDATLFEHEGLWWMFANISAHSGASSWDELHLFFAESPLSDNWQPHPLNPVVSDVRRARPAGRVFQRDGQIYRPSQDSSHRYGYGLNFNQILELSKEGYREQTVREIRPTWDRNILGVHSYSESGSLTVVDAIYRSPRFGRQSEKGCPANKLFCPQKPSPMS